MNIFKIKEYIQSIGVLPPLPNEILYKYSDISTSKLILNGSSLKFSNTADFDDATELSFDHYNLKMDDQDFWNLVNRTQSGSIDDKLNFYNKNYHNKHLIPNVIQSAILEQKNLIGVCCFSKNFNNNVMWGLYGDKHKGICLGFSGFAQEPEMFIMSVRYIKDLEPTDFWKERNRWFVAWIFTKSEEWKYQNEVRAVHIGFQGIATFPKVCLKEVIYGLKTPMKDIETIENIIKDNNYNVKRYKMIRNSYELTKEEYITIS